MNMNMNANLNSPAGEDKQHSTVLIRFQIRWSLIIHFAPNCATRFNRAPPLRGSGFMASPRATQRPSLRDSRFHTMLPIFALMHFDSRDGKAISALRSAQLNT